MTIPPTPEEGSSGRSGVSSGFALPGYSADSGPASSSDLRTSSTPFRAEGWSEQNAASFLAHLGRDTIHASKDRHFPSAWRRNADGTNSPRLYPVGSPALEKCQYAVLSHPQHSAVIVMDVDHPTGVTGGDPDAIHPEPMKVLTALCAVGVGPAWLGVNPVSGKAQAIWLIDPVYAAAGRTSPGKKLLRTVSRELNGVLSGDPAFSHYFSRWPLHRSSDPSAYRWHWQHDRVDRLADLLQEVRRMDGGADVEEPRARAVADRRFDSGRDRILAVRKAAEDARTLRELGNDLPDFADIAPAAAGIVDGVRIVWSSPGRAARDQTAFQHALGEARSLRKAGQVMRDEKIIAAYEHAYFVAQAVGADDREPEMPEISERLAMARRVRGYAISSTPRSTRSDGEIDMRSPGRKALSTMGSRGGKALVQRRAANPEEREPLRAGWERANKQRSRHAAATRARIYSIIAQSLSETDRMPTRKELAAEVGISPRSITTHLAALRAAGLIESD